MFRVVDGEFVRLCTDTGPFSSVLEDAEPENLQNPRSENPEGSWVPANPFTTELICQTGCVFLRMLLECG